MTETQRARVERWFADGTTWVGVFENKDLSSPNVGHKVAVPFDMADYDRAVVGRDRGPELLRKYGMIPWQYVLAARCLDPASVLTYVDPESPPPRVL